MLKRDSVVPLGMRFLAKEFMKRRRPETVFSLYQWTATSQAQRKTDGQVPGFISGMEVAQ